MTHINITLARTITVVVLGMVLVTLSCLPDQQKSDAERLPGDARDAKERGINVYWLGRSFSVNQLVVDEVGVSDYESTGPSFGLGYHTEGGLNIDLRSVASQATEEWRARALRPGNQPPKFKRDVRINGREATLVGVTAAGRPLVGLTAIIEFMR